IGQFVDVLITEVMANSLRGRVLTTGDVFTPGEQPANAESDRIRP
nr:TRAM domain-containing protein [Arenimonas sp.]